MNNYTSKFLLNIDSVKELYNIFSKESDKIYLVGGCVRDSFLEKEIKDFDIAAKLQPKKIIEVLNNHNIRYKNFAYRFGSINANINNQKFQITSLREDINPTGRDTNILFTNSLRKDAMRRDFTFNAFYLSKDGMVKDFFNGQKDINKKIVRFIGNPSNRIKEDYLRIFRYYRFLGLFEKPNYVENYESIINDSIHTSFDFLSNDIIRQEILKMFKMPYVLNCFFENGLNSKKREWVKITYNYFKKNNYKMGLNKCLNKIDLLIV
tara:strand:- start:894 stop:1688 length:795 start_codon:yes stop_codon:yes gene_type:complete